MASKTNTYYLESTQPKMLYTLQYTNNQGDTASLTGDYKQIINHILTTI